MRKFKALLALCLLAGVLMASGCASSPSSKLKAMKIKKTTDFLYEAVIDFDFDYDATKEYYKKYVPKLGGCSAISIGNVRGRNYDWEYSEGVEFVVKAPAKQGRHASIGIASVTDLTNDQVLDGTYYSEQYEMLPFLTLDGINDAGIYVNVNVVPFQSLGKWVMRTDNPDDDLCELCGTRLILDKCSYLEDIITEFDKYDWFSLGNAEEMHYMVTGPRCKNDPKVTTVVFEFVPFTEGGRTFTKLCVISNNADDEAIVKDKTRFYKMNATNIIMTNFNLWHFDPTLTREEQLGNGEGSVINEPMGYERYEILNAAGGDKESVTVVEMRDIMKKVYYSKAYNLFQPDFWYSEYGMTKSDLQIITDTNAFPFGDMDKLYKGNEKAYNLIKSQVEVWNTRDRKLGADQGLWETIHTSVFDYSCLTFYVIPHEGNIAYKFTLGE